MTKKQQHLPPYFVKAIDLLNEKEKNAGTKNYQAKAPAADNVSLQGSKANDEK